jgi:hypothetical protein
MAGRRRVRCRAPLSRRGLLVVFVVAISVTALLRLLTG